MKKIILFLLLITGLSPVLKNNSIQFYSNVTYAQGEFPEVEVCADPGAPVYLMTNSDGSEVWETCSYQIDCNDGTVIDANCTQTTYPCEYNCPDEGLPDCAGVPGGTFDITPCGCM
ncbi:hypothetical protein FYC62_12945 [Pedobacter aquae]|uniref:Uncharacterized protein n=1 Tax=Pedobacter aquae TaxID=2605747 RepID=A0A5C0VK31_9SPHI|nr:hypothetical protein [Pedobacter aquae]QEK52459.1 hypothetical protein FYC62_12945 [Pedobacter aquae]